MMTSNNAAEHAVVADRNAWQAMKNGSRFRCPSCAKGLLFKGFLKVAPVCTHCHEELHHHRADDLPPYIVITIVGHIIVPLIMLVEMFTDFSTGMQMILWPMLTLILSLLLMQPVKGAVVGYQWALRLHGFDSTSSMDDPAANDPLSQEKQ